MAFDPYRKFAACVFCGARNNLTREHLFGHSLAQFLSVKQNWMAPQIVVTRPGRLAQIKRGSSPITSVAPPLLCGACNSGRLGLVMQSSLPLLESLCEGQKTVLTDHDRVILRRYCERFAAIVDVCTSNEQVSDMTPQQAASFQVQLQHQKPAITTFGSRNAWLDGAHLEAVTTYIGHHQGLLGLNPDLNVTHQPDFDGSWKRITFVVKHLAVCIDVGKPDISVPSSFHVLSAATSFPTLPPATYDDYLALWYEDQKVLFLRTFLRFPDAVREWEDHLRSGKRAEEFWVLKH
jgi:hypothetical protein